MKCRNSTLASRSDGHLRLHRQRQEISTTSTDATALYRELEIALPHELTLEQNRYLLQDWIKENVTRKGLICEAFIHAPPRGGDERNIHAHVMVTTRPLDGTEFIAKKPSCAFKTWTEAKAARDEQLAAEKASWQKLGNRHLERHGFEGNIDLGRKQNGDEPTIHLGKKATAQERAGRATDKGDHNRKVKADNEQRRQAANQNRPRPAPAPEPPRWFEENAPPPLERDERAEPAPDLTQAPDPRDLARGRTEDGSVIYLRQPPEPAHQPEPEPEAAHAPESRHGEAAPARPSYLPGIVIHLPYDPAPGLAPHIMRPAREAEAEARAGREEAAQATIAKVEARIAEADRQEAEKTPEQLAAERESYRQEQEAAKLGPVSEKPADFRSVWDEVRDHTKAEPEAKPTHPRGIVPADNGREPPEVNLRPGLIFVGKCLEWGIAMAGRIVDAIASIFETRQERRDERREAERLSPPPPAPEIVPPPLKRSVADELRAQAKAHHELTQQQREGVEHLRDVLRDPNNPRHRGHTR